MDHHANLQEAGLWICKHLSLPTGTHRETKKRLYLFFKMKAAEEYNAFVLSVRNPLLRRLRWWVFRGRWSEGHAGEYFYRLYARTLIARIFVQYLDAFVNDALYLRKRLGIVDKAISRRAAKAISKVYIRWLPCCKYSLDCEGGATYIEAVTSRIRSLASQKHKSKTIRIPIIPVDTAGPRLAMTTQEMQARMDYITRRLPRDLADMPASKKACWKCMAYRGTVTCGSCRVARYCSKQCQEAHWNVHRHQCKDMASTRISRPARNTIDLLSCPGDTMADTLREKVLLDSTLCPFRCIPRGDEVLLVA